MFVLFGKWTPFRRLSVVEQIFHPYLREIGRRLDMEVEVKLNSKQVLLDMRRFSKAPEGDYTIFNKKSGYGVACFTLTQLPGCCGVLVSTGAWVGYTGRGIGTLLNKLRIELAKNMGYGILMCTDLTDNIAQRRILEKNGWKDIYDFTNPRTGNHIAVSVYDITKEGK